MVGKPEIILLMAGISLCGLSLGCDPVTNGRTTGVDSTVTIKLDASQAGRPVKKYLFGNNIEWVDRGSGSLEPGSGKWEKLRLAAIKKTKPTSIRFPGGCQADTYHWQDGIGAPADRRPGIHYFSQEENASQFGTVEFLELCRRLQARPIMTLNIVTGTPEEAAAWAIFTHQLIKQKKYPKILFWEIGNEQYLESRFGRWTPERYNRVYQSYANAILERVPDAALGALMVPKILDDYFQEKNGQSWNHLLLKNHAQRIDYVCLHNAYSPGPISRPGVSDRALFKRTLAHIDNIKADYQWINSLLARYQDPDQPIQIALTEYNTFYGIQTPYQHVTKTWSSALYTANLLLELMTIENVTVANYWSMYDNWHFGLVEAGRKKRPAFHVLALFATFQGKQLLAVSPASGDPIRWLAIKRPQDGQLAILMINNSVTETISVELEIQSKVPYRMIKSKQWQAAALQATEVEIFSDEPTAITAKVWQPLAEKNQPTTNEVEMSKQVTLAPASIKLVSFY